MIKLNSTDETVMTAAMVIVAAAVFCYILRSNTARRLFMRYIVPFFLMTVLYVSHLFFFFPYNLIPLIICLAVFFFYLYAWGKNPIIYWIGSMFWTLNDICRHTCIVGQTGSGKTLALKSIIRKILYNQPGAGGMIIEDKSDFADEILKILNKLGFAEKLVTLKVNPVYNDTEFTPEYRVNILDYGNMPRENWASIICETAKSFQKSTDSFFPEQTSVVIKDAMYFTDYMLEIKDFIMPAFHKRIEKHVGDSKEQMDESYLRIIPDLCSIDQIHDLLIFPEKLKIFLEFIRDFIREYPLPENNRLQYFAQNLYDNYANIVKETKDGIKLNVSNYLSPFCHKDIVEVFCSPEPNFSINEIESGKIVSLSVPQHHSRAKRYLNTIFKTILYDLGNQRFSYSFSKKNRMNLLLGVFDEAQNIVTDSPDLSDYDAAAKLRAAKMALFFSTQDMKSYYPRLDKDKTDILLFNLSTKFIFKVADGASAERISKILGKKLSRKTNYTTGKNNSKSHSVDKKPRFEADTLMNLPVYSCVICHVNGTMKKIKLPPDGKLGIRPGWYYLSKILGES